MYSGGLRGLAFNRGIKVPITPKYFVCLNKSLHLFETHCAIFWNLAIICHATEPVRGMDLFLVWCHRLICIVLSLCNHACKKVCDVKRNRPIPLTCSIVWQMMARFRNFYSLLKINIWVKKGKKAQCILRRLERVFWLLQCLWNDGRLQRRVFNGVDKLYVSLQLYCWAILKGYLWRHISYHGNAQGAQKCPLNFSFCKLSEKLIRWPTIFIYLLESSLNYLTFQRVRKKFI